MNPDEVAFYEERDRRSRQYVINDGNVPVGPAGIVIAPDAAECPAAQLATLALVNMLARVHRTLVVSVPAAPLVVPQLLGTSTTLEAAVHQTARAINPFIRLSPRPVGDTTPVVGLGASAPAGLDGYLLIDGWQGGITNAPTAAGGDPASMLGAGAAACISAAFLFHLARGRRPAPHVVSLWELGDGREGRAPSVAWPLNVGDVLVIGAGAVGSALAFWLRAVGVESDWCFIDPDIARLHNTNRSLGMTAADAGWPTDTVGRHKSRVASHLLRENGSYEVATYREWLSGHPNARPDLVIPVANDDGVRSAVMGRGEPILIHGSTSPNWTAELHRHIPDIDDCIPCRLPDSGEPRLTCSSGPVDPGNASSSDAALPFLSGAAGLLLLTGLAQLQLGALPTLQRNHWRLHLDLGSRAITSTFWSCASGCNRVLPRDIRLRVQRGGRWVSIDPASA